MRDIFYEETVINANFNNQKTAHTIFKSLAVISSITSILWFIINFFTIDFAADGLIIKLIIAFLPSLLFVLCTIIFIKLSNNFCVEFDYILVNNSLSFSKVIKNSKRINLLEIDVKRIERIGVYGSDSYYRYKNTPDVKEIYLTPNKTPNLNNRFIYVFINHNSQKKILILEASVELIKNMKNYINCYAIDEELKK